jgi:plastocyanin
MDPGMAMRTPGAASAAAVTIHVHGFAYSDPGPVPPGATVNVMNMDPEAHTVAADDGSFTVTAPPGQTVSFTAPTKPGAYPYHCQYHSNMHATLTVK